MPVEPCVQPVLPGSRMTTRLIMLACSGAAAWSAAPCAASAPERVPGELKIMIGAGAQTKPSFPGASSNRLVFLPEVDVWREGEPMTVETPDESIGIALVGKRSGRFAAGPALGFAPTRAATDLPGLGKVGFGVEAGVFAEFWPLSHLRLHAEMRRGIGAHKALTGDMAADLVFRQGNEGPIFTAGPRVRWGSAKYNRTYFGVASPGTAALAPFDLHGGVYAIGAAAGLHLPLGKTVGLYGFAGYDRLTGRSRQSPIVLSGSPDQLSGGVALTYRFGL